MPVSGPHRFEVEGWSVDTAANTVTRLHPPAAFERDPAAGSDDDERYLLVRDEPDGRARWSAKLHGLRSVRPPDLAVGGGRVIATIDLTIHAFDDATGRPRWSANVEGDNLHIAGDAVSSTFCNEPTHDHWLVANALADGAKRFQVPLANDCDPAIVIRGNRIFAVESTPPEETRVFDLAGHLVTTLHEQVQSAQPVSHGLVVVGDKHLMSLDPSGKVLSCGAARRRRTASSAATTSSSSPAATWSSRTTARSATAASTSSACTPTARRCGTRAPRRSTSRTRSTSTSRTSSRAAMRSTS